MGFLYIIIAVFFFSFLTVTQKKILNKSSIYIAIWGNFLCALPFIVILNIIFGFPEITNLFWVYLGLSLFLNAICQIFLFKGLKLSDISLAIPLLSFTPAFLIFTSWI
ncbi:MAG: EamA family transporter, partial [Patescibacteria group bacterium]